MKQHKYAMPLPIVGEHIYVPSEGMGADRIQGGKALVTKIEKGKDIIGQTDMIIVEPFPKKRYDWYFLSQKQDELKEAFGPTIFARHDPEDPDNPISLLNFFL